MFLLHFYCQIELRNTPIQFTKQNLNKGRFVILDVLESGPLLELFQKEEFAKKTHFKTALLYLPISKYVDRIRGRNENAKSENELRDPFDMITQYSLFFVITAEQSEKSIEQISEAELRGLFLKAADDAEKLFIETEWADDLEQLQKNKKRIIEEEMAKLNPGGLTRGFLTLKPDIKVDVLVNTFELSPDEVAKKLLH